MITAKLLDTDIEFINLIKLIAAYSVKVGVPFWQNVHEVVSTFITPLYITVVVYDGDEIDGYVAGHFQSTNEFIFSQAYHHPRPGSEYKGDLPYVFFEKEAQRRGATKLLLLTSLPVEVFEKYGFKFEKFLLTKYL